MGDFLSTLFGGSNPTLSKGIDQLGSLAGYSANLGQNDTNLASQYYAALLSGDPSKISQALAPEISANQDQAEQQKRNIAEFGNRSGGNTAAANAIDTHSRGNIIDLIGQLMGGAAGNLGNLGTTNLGMATNDINSQAGLSQAQMANRNNSIFGGLLGGLGGNLGQIFSGTLGKIPGLSSVI